MACTVVLPAYNEENHIKSIINEVKKVAEHIVVVDDGSSDNTISEAKNAGAIVLQHRVNMGKGAALKTGCDFAYRNGATHIIVMDSDGQHKAEDIPRFQEAVKEYDIVYGYRKQSRTMPFVLRFGNSTINSMLNVLFNTNIKDSQSGFRAFTRDAYRKIRWNARDYCLETEMVMNASRHKLQHLQIPIETIYNDNYKGTTVLDGIKIVMKIIGGRIGRW